MSCNCLLNYIISKLDQTEKNEMLNGATIELPDNGFIYSRLQKNKCGTITFFTSHESNGYQYRCNKMFAPLLFGLSINNNTFFQFEAHEVCDPCHGADLCYYIYFDRNVGKYGTSSYTSNHPLLITKSRFYSWFKMSERS